MGPLPDLCLSSSLLQYEAKALSDLLRLGHPTADKKVGGGCGDGLLCMIPMDIRPQASSCVNYKSHHYTVSMRWIPIPILMKPDTFLSMRTLMCQPLLLF